MRVESETRQEKRQRIEKVRKLKSEKAVEDGLATWDPSKDSSLESDAFKTLFVGRLSYDVTEKKLRRDFEEFGPVKSVSLVHDKCELSPPDMQHLQYHACPTVG